MERSYNVNVRQPSAPTRSATATVIAFAALLLVTLDGSAAPDGRTPQKKTSGEIEALAFDGSRVAYDVGAGYGAKRRCNTVYVWNLRRNVTTRVSGRQTCGADSTSTGAGVRELALAGSRAAWIVNKGGNTESGDYLYVAALAKPGERLLAAAFRTGDVDGILTGNWLGGLVGARSFLGVDHWATDTHGAVRTARLQSVGAHLRDLAEGTATMTARSTDGRQVAVVRADETVGLYSTRGRLLRTVTPSTPTEVAVRGDYLAVLTTADTLEVYNSHSGRRLHTWDVAHGARSLDVSSGLAAYAAPRAGGYARVVHVVRLSNGKDRVLATTPPQLVAVRIEPAGLVYAVNRIGAHETGFLVFTPMSRLRR
jgi:hypothetical protein